MSSPFAVSPRELQAMLAAERAGFPFLAWRDGGQRLLTLPDQGRLTIGRELDCDVALPDDDEVSRRHAELERVGARWVLADHGLSRNGTFVNGDRLLGKRRLRDGDTVRFGTTQVLFRDPAPRAAAR